MATDPVRKVATRLGGFDFLFVTVSGGSSYNWVKSCRALLARRLARSARREYTGKEKAAIAASQRLRALAPLERADPVRHSLQFVTASPCPPPRKPPRPPRPGHRVHVPATASTASTAGTTTRSPLDPDHDLRCAPDSSTDPSPTGASR